MSDKKCPFINMAPCIGKECVMFLDSGNFEHQGKEYTGNLYAIRTQPPCAILQAGLKAAVDLLGLSFQSKS